MSKDLKKKLDLVCYCCGTPVREDFALVTMSEGQTDRVFIMISDHVKRVDYASSFLVTSALTNIKDIRG